MPATKNITMAAMGAYNMPKLLEYAGSASVDECSYDPVGEILTVNDIDQTALDGAFTNYTASYAADTTYIDAQKAEAKISVDVSASTQRAKYITIGYGQEMTYLQKLQEAEDYKTAGYPADMTGYEFVEAEKNAIAGTGQDAADSIIATAAAWKVKGIAIEEERRTGKIAVDAAADVAAVESARDAAIALIEAI